VRAPKLTGELIELETKGDWFGHPDGIWTKKPLNQWYRAIGEPHGASLMVD
jgi:hypothetical protein